MSLKNYTGPSNHSDVFRALVGERIAGVVFDDKGMPWLVVESGHAVVVGSRGDDRDPKGPIYWVEQPEQVKRLVNTRKEQLRASAAAIRELCTLPLGDE